MIDKLKSAVIAVAPILGSALGGPLGGAAASVLSQKLLGKKEASDQEILDAVLQMTPEQATELKKAEIDFATRELEIAYLDRDSARKLASTNSSWIYPVLAMTTMLSFFGIIVYVLVIGLHLDVNTAAFVGMLIGYVSSKAEQVMNFYFGSSAGSRSKDFDLRKK